MAQHIPNPPPGHAWHLQRSQVWSPDRFHLHVTCPADGCGAAAEFAYGFHGYEVYGGEEVFNKFMAVPEDPGLPEIHMKLHVPHSVPVGAV